MHQHPEKLQGFYRNLFRMHYVHLRFCENWISISVRKWLWCAYNSFFLPLFIQINHNLKYHTWKTYEDCVRKMLIILDLLCWKLYELGLYALSTINFLSIYHFYYSKVLVLTWDSLFRVHISELSLILHNSQLMTFWNRINDFKSYSLLF